MNNILPHLRINPTSSLQRSPIIYSTRALLLLLFNLGCGIISISKINTVIKNWSPMSRIFHVFVVSLLLTSCTSTVERLKRVGKAPDLANLEVPIDENQLSPAQKEQQTKAYMRRTNSLWQPGSTSFFRDNRAWRIGDILRVVVNVKDSATLANSTQQKRDGKDFGGIGELFGKKKAIYGTLGLPKTPAGNTIQNMVDISSTRDIKGSGNITRQESIQTEVAALVKQILPNGNLVIEGHQEIRINHELREIKVAGIIRSRDISSDNSISSDQIAEARISYGGRGVVSDMQQPRVGSQVVDIISPF